MDDRGEMIAKLDEQRRLHALYGMGVLDSAPDPRFDRIVRTAAALFEAERAALVLIDADRLWFKARHGITITEHPRRGTLAELMVHKTTVTICPDIRNDPFFIPHLAERPAVDVRFYACAPLVAPGGQIIGLLVVGDPQVGPPSRPALQIAMADLAAMAMAELTRDAERAEARARRRLDQERVTLALQAARLGEFEWDFTDDTLTVSPRAAELTGLAAGRLAARKGDALLQSMHPDDREAGDAAIRAALREDDRYELEYRCIQDGQVVWRYAAGVVVRDAYGLAERIIGVVQDIDSRKRHEAERESLLDELDHRVKNVLAAVQSLAAQSARRTTSLDGFLKTFSGRLKAMASAHDLLTTSRWRGAALSDLAAAELGGLAPNQTRWEGPDLFLTPRAAGALSLALHELAINAVKYGALSTESGRVEVTWRITPQGGFALEWMETGGPAVAPPTRRGFGSTLFSQVTGRELGGAVETDYRPGGLRARITAGPEALAEVAPDLAAREADRMAGRLAETFLAAADPDAPRDIRGLRVLIVEDSVLLALELEAGLTDAGAVVIGVAATVDEAMALLNQPFDAAVLDANLDGLSVSPVAQALQDRGTPFVFATGYADKAAPLGFDAPIVRKPYNVGQIAAALAEAMDRS